MEKSLFRVYTGDDIISVSKDIYIPVVDSIIHKGDLVMMNGYRKSNKSTYAMQLACAVSSGTPFLETFNVPKPGIVWFFSTEGKDNEFKERIIRMKKVVPANLDNLRIFCSSQFKFNTSQGFKAVDELTQQYKEALPILIIIDSVYSGFSGSLKDDETVNTFLTVIRRLSERCNNAAMWLTHHLKKPSRDRDGNWMSISDLEGGFGSVFFGGQADHVFRIDFSGKDKLDRTVICETQRSNKIIDEMYLHLNEPDPFYLSLMGTHDKEQDIIIKLLSNNIAGFNTNDIMHKTDISKSLCYIVLNELVAKGRIKKGTEYGGIYQLL